MEAQKNASGVSAIVLAAGSSTRMGTVKALVQIAGKPMLERVLSTLHASRVDETVVVLGHSAQLIQEKVAFGAAKTVINNAYQDGMASSLRLGLSGLGPDAEAALVVLADQPFIASETINQLIQEYRSKRPEIIVPVYNGFRGNPVLLSRSVFPEVAALTGDVGCRAIFGGHTRGILKVPVHDAGILVDLDTKADVRRFEQSAREAASDLFNNADLSDRHVSGPQLVIVGQDPVARALIDFARLLGFSVALVDPFARADDFPAASVLRVLNLSALPHADETFVAITSRGRFDEEAIEQALNMDVAYIALLANKRRAHEIRFKFLQSGFSEEKLARLRAPAGLEIGAVTPAEIALSIIAEIISIRNRAQHN